MQTQNSSSSIYVWDWIVRIFHWSVASAFMLAYLTAEEWRSGHKFFGYVITGLVIARVLWGFIGSRHARFSDFLVSPRNTLTYIKSMLSGNPARFIGHNPAGGWMIIALMAMLLLTTFSGMLMIAPAGKGPLAHTFIAGLGGHWLEDFHEFFANTSVFLVVLHVSGVLFSSLLHHENLVRAMLTGYKSAEKNDEAARQVRSVIESGRHAPSRPLEAK